MRLALLANPRSGDGDAAEVERLLSQRGADVEVFEIDRHDAAADSGAERIVVAGGDGSIGCAARAAQRAGVPLAVIAAGTANDFARALDLPRDHEAAAALAVEGTRTRRLDLGLVDDERPFVNAVSAGLSPAAAQEAHGLKAVLGPLAYSVGALRAGLFAQPVACEARVDGAEAFAGDAWQVTVGLTGAFGGGAEVEADPGDGRLDLVVVEAGSRIRLAARAFGMRAGRLERQGGVVTGSGCEIDVAIEGAGEFNVDGEIERGRELRLTIEPHAFELVVAEAPRRTSPRMLALVFRRDRRASVLARSRGKSLFARRKRHPLLAALGDADQAVLRYLRTHGHQEPAETVMKALGLSGEMGAIWVAIGAAGASIDERRRSQWLAGAVTAPVAIGINFVLKRAIGRQRPLIEEHPPLAKAPTKLSFPSAHATSSIAAATAFGRIEPRSRPYVFALAGAVCVGRPYLGMHYPSDVLGGAALGFCLGSLVPGLGRPPTEERLFELAVDANERAQATGRATGNGGAVSAVAADGPPAEASETA